MFETELQNLKRVFYQFPFYYKINFRISSEARHMINFEHPGFEFVIKHDIETKQVEAAVRFFSLTRAIQMCKLRLNGKDSLNYHLFHFRPDLLSMFPVRPPVRAVTDHFSS